MPQPAQFTGDLLASHRRQGTRRPGNRGASIKRKQQGGRQRHCVEGNKRQIISVARPTRSQQKVIHESGWGDLRVAALTCSRFPCGTAIRRRNGNVGRYPQASCTATAEVKWHRGRRTCTDGTGCGRTPCRRDIRAPPGCCRPSGRAAAPPPPAPPGSQTPSCPRRRTQSTPTLQCRRSCRTPRAHPAAGFQARACVSLLQGGTSCCGAKVQLTRPPPAPFATAPAQQRRRQTWPLPQ